MKFLNFCMFINKKDPLKFRFALLSLAVILSTDYCLQKKKIFHINHRIGVHVYWHFPDRTEPQTYISPDAADELRIHTTFLLKNKTSAILITSEDNEDWQWSRISIGRCELPFCNVHTDSLRQMQWLNAY